MPWTHNVIYSSSILHIEWNVWQCTFLWRSFIGDCFMWACTYLLLQHRECLVMYFFMETIYWWLFDEGKYLLSIAIYLWLQLWECLAIYFVSGFFTRYYSMWASTYHPLQCWEYLPQWGGREVNLLERNTIISTHSVSLPGFWNGTYIFIVSRYQEIIPSHSQKIQVL